jgi:MtN3 and saliva related transmembrane protein
MPHHSAHHWVRFVHLNKKQQKLLIKRSVLAMAIIEPIMTLPQIYEIWIERRTEGPSIASWLLYSFAAIVWLLYGLQLKDKPLIISSSLWIVMEATVVIGVLVYS